MTPEQAEWKLLCVAEAFNLAPAALAIQAVREIVKAQAPSKRAVLARAVIVALARDVIQRANGTGHMIAESIADDAQRIVAPAAILQSSLGRIAHDEPELPAKAPDGTKPQAGRGLGDGGA